jgi:hypothetical protein
MRFTKRNSERKQVSRPAKIYSQEREFVCACTVLDISDTGARLTVEAKDIDETPELPPEFILSFTFDENALNETLSVVRECRVVWEREGKIGVQFPGRRPYSDI